MHPIKNMGNITLQKWSSFVDECPFEFSVQYPPRPEYFEEYYSSIPKKTFLQKTIPKLLYVHVPFCETKCSYCFFATDHNISYSRMETYTNSVINEVKRYPLLDTLGVDCIDIGGGTPTILPEKLLDKLLSRVGVLVKSKSPLSRSIETTPKQASLYTDKLNIIRNHGFKRISMGIQSFSSIILNNVNRQQKTKEISTAIHNIHKANFHRFNLDLIFGLPSQTLSIWQQDLVHAVSFYPDSITIYDCLYRGKGKKLAKDMFNLPSLAVIDQLYDWAYSYLTQNGYFGEYGSVNFSRHKNETGTSDYFEKRLLWGGAYLGLGNYATTLYQGFWLFNNYKVDDYVKNIEKGNSTTEYCYNLKVEELVAKYLLFSLNYGRIDIDHFYKIFGTSLNLLYKQELDFAQKNDLIKFENSNIYIANKKFSNLYLLRSFFYSKTAKKWFFQMLNNGEQ
jgi:oxygen-independent coproporphyrinogen-3 oxidase